MVSRLPTAALLTAAALCGSLALALPAAAAEPAAQPTAADKDTARNLMDVGHAKYDAGDYKAALEAYQGADKIMHVTSTGLGVGKALMKLGRLLEARDKLLAVTRIVAKENEPGALAAARAEAGKLETELAERIPSLKLKILGLPNDAKTFVTIDGNDVAPELQRLPRRVDPGKHTIVCKAIGYADVTLEVTVPEGGEHTATVELKPGKSTATEDGPGKAEPGKDDQPSSGVSPLVYVGFGVAGAGLIAGAVTGGLSLSAASSAKEGCTGNVCPIENEGDADSSIALGHVSTVSFVLAGAGAAVGVVGLVIGGSDESAADSATKLVVGPSWAGVRGTF